ncbi:hypothetical protein S40293_09147 [Stachybotrys chartarum IBT 40293]|nr:hypothetical protein S40293_09147 [Stachybotrys chartarum IBT 40293]
MNLFLCPNASPALLRSSFRLSYLAKPSGVFASSPARWLSCSTSNGRHATARAPLRDTGLPPGPRRTAPEPAYPSAYRRTLFAPRIIRDYQELPRDYRDKVGLPFRSKDLTEAEVRQIFGAGIAAPAANHLLRMLHGRRVAGTLYDPSYAIHTAQFSDDQIEQALEYLRRTVPVEETMNAGLRAEDELEEMEREMEAERQRKETGEEELKIEPDPVYGRSALDEIRARNIAMRKSHEKSLAEGTNDSERQPFLGPLARFQEEDREITNPKVAEYYAEAQSDLQEPPPMSFWRRVLPSAAVVIAVSGLLAFVATIYEEPAAAYRLLPQFTTSQVTVGAIVALNLLVYLGWKVPPLWKFFNQRMILVVATIKPVTLFTSIFSHQVLGHMLGNLIPLWFIGTALHDEMGRAGFLALFLACGAFGYLGTLATYTARGVLGVTSLGASGAVHGICGAYFWEHRNDGFRFFGLPDEGVHGVVFLALQAGVHLAAALRPTAKIDVASHVLGWVTGILGMELFSRHRRKDEKRDKKIINALPQQTSQAQRERYQREAESYQKAVEGEGALSARKAGG